MTKSNMKYGEVEVRGKKKAEKEESKKAK